MIRLDNIHVIYFIGIGGIGMSALARYFSFHGKKVSGYDRTETALTRTLVEEGIGVTYSDDASLAPRDADLVVYTPAVPAQHAQLNYYRNNEYTVVKRSDVLGAITEQSYNICVAGTHGKTTISTMIAHILRQSGYGCNAFLGGIAANYNSNFWSSENNTCVVEADEYDRSFLKLSPDIAVITAMDADHLDIYGTAEAMQDAFVSFGAKLKPGGTLYLKKGLAREKDFSSATRVLYSLDDQSADVHTENIQMMQGHYLFDVSIQGKKLGGITLNMGGLHNVENATVAIAIARQLGIADDAIRESVKDFKGVKRRFEYIVKQHGLVYIDDYAHHPEELSSLIRSAKSLFSDLPCTVIFQPHLFTRTRDLAAEFAASLSLADEAILLPIYPARELPIEGVSSEMILGKISRAGAKIIDKKNLVSFLEEKKLGKKGTGTLLITAGAGDIDTLVQPIKQLLSKNN